MTDARATRSLDERRAEFSKSRFLAMSVIGVAGAYDPRDDRLARVPRTRTSARGLAWVYAGSRAVRMAERSMTIPSSQTAVPATLWPPPRIAISKSRSRAKRMAATTSAVPVHRAIRQGRRSTVPFHTARATS
jgi:hypothetical protein